MANVHHPAPLQLSAIASLHENRVAALQLFYSEANPDFIRSFGTYSTKEVEAERVVQLAEADRDGCLTLLAAIEAAFQNDFRARILRKSRQKSNDDITREFKKLQTSYGKRRKRVPFDEKILEVWKTSDVVGGSLVSEIRAAFRYRHWLAHGRYWELKLGRAYDFYSIATLAQQVWELPLVIPS